MEELDRIQSIVNIALNDTPYWVYKLTIENSRSGRTIKLMIDADSPISLKDCEIVTHKMRRQMDLEDISYIYNLEVSSPGAEREIKIPDEIERFKGKWIKVKVQREKGIDSIIGIIDGLEEDYLLLLTKVNKQKEQMKKINIQDIVKANLYIDMRSIR